MTEKFIGDSLMGMHSLILIERKNKVSGTEAILLVDKINF
jgi:hypothetical protein